MLDDTPMGMRITSALRPPSSHISTVCQCSIETLPRELLATVLSFLDFRALLALAQTNRRWYGLCTSVSPRVIIMSVIISADCCLSCRKPCGCCCIQLISASESGNRGRKLTLERTGTGMAGMPGSGPLRLALAAMMGHLSSTRWPRYAVWTPDRT
jgi:hypothetical protein